MIVEYTIKDDKPTIHIFVTNSNGIREHKVVENFEPYFYVNYDEQVPQNDRIKRVELEHEMYGPYKSIFGTQVKKVFTKLPSDVKDLRGLFKKTYEDDILFPTRYTIDMIHKIEGVLRIATIDIEVNDKHGMPNWEKPNEEVISCAVHDSHTGHYWVLYWRRDLQKQIRKEENAVYVSLNTEEDFLSELTECIRRIDPDIITGWNVGFDVQYLIARMHKLNLKPERLSPLYYVDENREKILGRVVFDMLAGYKKLKLKEMRSFSLKYVASAELGIQKIEREDLIYDMWNDNLDDVLKYNKRDVELVVELNKKHHIIQLYDEVRRITKVDFSRVLNYSVSVDCALLEYCKGMYVLPGHRKRVRKKKIEGALVIPPKKGIWKNVAVFDLTRSYPSAMISCNLSPETKSKDGDIVINDKLKFKSSPRGIIPSVLNDLIILREEKKKLMKEYIYGSDEYNIYYTQQFALKSIINSFYGVMGFRDFRMYDVEVASAVTEVGRKLITWCMNIAKQSGYDVIYSDTDSIFVPLKNKDLDTQILEAYALKERIVNTLDDFALTMNVRKHVFDLDFDKVFSSLIFTSAKKKYNGKLSWLGGSKVDKMVTVGFESVRSDTTILGKDIQSNLFRLIHSDKSVEEIRDEALKYLNDEIKKVRSNYYKLSDISPPSSITKSFESYKVQTMSVRAAKNAMWIGKEYKPGDKPLMLFLSKVPKGTPPMDVVLFDEDKDIPKGFIPDYEKIIERSITSKVEDILEAIGLTYEEVINGQKQTKLW